MTRLDYTISDLKEQVSSLRAKLSKRDKQIEALIEEIKELHEQNTIIMNALTTLLNKEEG